ncbi:MAG: hypothetical protein RSB71_01890 [Bacilli bacterium]
MLEMLKSKTIILFVVLVFGLVFIGGSNNKLEDSKTINEHYLAYNLK